MAATARGLVEAQEVLDARGSQSLITWDGEGIPPSMWVWADCRLRFSPALSCLPKSKLTERTRLKIAAHNEGPCSLTFTIRRLSTRQTEGER